MLNNSIVYFLDQIPDISLLILFFFSFCSCFCSRGDLYQKSQSSVVQSRPGWISPYCLSSECASTDGVGFRIWRHTFKMAVMTSFREKPLVRHVWRHWLAVCSTVPDPLRSYLFFTGSLKCFNWGFPAALSAILFCRRRLYFRFSSFFRCLISEVGAAAIVTKLWHLLDGDPDS